MPEVGDVVVLHHVGLGFEPLFAVAFGSGFTAVGIKVLRADDLGADEVFWMSEWMAAAASQAIMPCLISHARFSLPPTVRCEM